MKDNFNPRPREEGDTSFCDSRRNGDYFNPRPREEGDSFHCLYYTVLLYFNPRPREEGDAGTNFFARDLGISIHALVKRATANLYNDYLYFEAKYHISDIFHQ